MRLKRVGFSFLRLLKIYNCLNKVCIVRLDKLKIRIFKRIKIWKLKINQVIIEVRVNTV